MSLIDECTVLDQPLRGWIESDLFAFGSRHTHPSIDDRGEICAFACDKVRPSHAFFARLLEPAIPNFCAQLFVWSKVRPHVMNLVVVAENLVNSSVRRACKKEMFDHCDNVFFAHISNYARFQKQIA